MKQCTKHSLYCVLLLLLYAPVLGAGTTVFTGSADAVMASGDTLVFSSGSLAITQDRVISLPGNNAHAYVTIGASAGSGSVTVAPASTSTPSILLFDVKQPGSLLEVQVLNNLTFQGNAHNPLFVGVRGKGEVRFRLPWGAHISFKATSASNAGAHLRVLMEQNQAQMKTSTQLSFVSWGLTADSVSTDNTKHTIIEFGQNSSFVFLSQHKTGLVDSTGALDYGYGSISFDPSNSSTGRMVLKLDAGQTPLDFVDAAFNIYGCYVCGSGVTPTDILTADMRTLRALPDTPNGVVYAYRAGLGAMLRIDDAVARDAFADDAIGLVSYLQTPANMRGLAVINYNRSFPRLANNYDQTQADIPASGTAATPLTQSFYFLANEVQPGFILGNNGIIEIQNNRNLDYYAAGVNAPLDEFPAPDIHVPDGSTTTGGQFASNQVKQHNPSAFIIDGYAFRRTGTTAVYDADFEYDAPLSDYAQISLFGNAGVFARVAADSVSGRMQNVTTNAGGTQYADFTGTYLDGSIGAAAYDGLSVMMRNDDGSIASTISPFGEVVIDVEGPLHVRGQDTLDEHVATKGFLNIPSILLDNAGREFVVTGGHLSLAGPRPLSLASTDTYRRYNNSVMLVNGYMRWENITWVHNDVGRDVTYIGTGKALPMIIGGELPSLKVTQQLIENPGYWVLDYSGSPIFLENSTIACHESMVVAGVHLVVRDHAFDLDSVGRVLNNEPLTFGDNASQIVFYNRGYTYDLDISGVGRYFQLGSLQNTMADGLTHNTLTLIDGVTYPVSSLRDAFIDVYKQWPLPIQFVPSDTSITPMPTSSIVLSLQTAFEYGVPTTEKSMHVFHLEDRSSVNLGWPAGQCMKTTDAGEVPAIEVDANYTPWEFTDAVLASLQEADPTNVGGTRFSPYEQGVGTLQFAGPDIYVGASGRFNALGVLSPANNELSPRGISDNGGIIYANFGGHITSSGNSPTLLDTVIGRMTAAPTLVATNGLAAAGAVDIEQDLLIFQQYGKIETYGFDTKVNPEPPLTHGSVTPIVSVNVADLPTPVGWKPIKTVEFRGPGDNWPYKRFMTRTIDSITAPVTMPTSGLLVMTSGDVVDQMQVYGATRALPFHLLLSGDFSGYSRVREFVSVASDPPVLGEGAFAALFLEKGARIGLGSRKVNGQSVNAWNQLGLDTVGLYPNGNGVVDLNDDIYIKDKFPIVATTNFGNETHIVGGTNTGGTLTNGVWVGATNVGGTTEGVVHSLTFYSAVPREIRLLSGGELDLSSFGAGLPGCQRIVFAGHTRLVIEPGAKIRFPSSVTSNNPACGPILYFDDNSKCIFLSTVDSDMARWTDVLTGSDTVRDKIMGIGTITLDKNAQLIINDGAFVGVEADSQTPHTDVTLTVLGQAQCLLGDINQTGGALQIGNVVDGGGTGNNSRPSSTDLTYATATQPYINFTLNVNGPNAVFRVGQNAFLGLGAGVVNKGMQPQSLTPNGLIPATSDTPPAQATDPSVDDYHFYAWQTQALFNVKNITINVTEGYFDHNQIYDGSAASQYGSVLAIGPIDYNAGNTHDAANGGRYAITLGDPSNSFIRGGGNMLFVDADATVAAPCIVSIWSQVQDISTTTSNTGIYTMFVPSAMLRTFTTPAFGSEVITATTTSYSLQSRTVPNNVDSSAANAQGGALIEFYGNLGMPDYAGWKVGYVAAGPSPSGGAIAGYVLDGRIVRQPLTLAKNRYGNIVAASDAIAKGYFIGVSASGATSTGGPQSLSVPL